MIYSSSGYGVYVNTSTGSVAIGNNSVVSDNKADGIKYNFHRKEPEKSAADTILDFCRGPSNPDQTYPLVTLAIQENFSFRKASCERVSFLNYEIYILVRIS